MPYAKIPLPAAPAAAVLSSCRTVENRIASNSQKFLYTESALPLEKVGGSDLAVSFREATGCFLIHMEKEAV